MSEPGWLQDLRSDARGHYDALGLPSPKLEDWRYTASALKPLADLALDAWPDLTTPAAPRSGELDPPLPAAPSGMSQVVFVDGHHPPGASSASGAVQGLASLLSGGDDEALQRTLGQLAPIKRDAFAALNTAHFRDGAFVHLGRGQRLEQPLQLVFVSTGAAPAATFPRLAIRAEAGSEATVVVEFHSAPGAGGFTNAQIEVDLAADAMLDLVLLQQESDAAVHVSRCHVRQEATSRLCATTITLGGACVRNDVEVSLVGEAAETTLEGLFLGLGSQHLDNHTLVDHAVPRCTSRERYKGVLADRARGVFRGRVVVRPDAQQTAAEQSNANLLLGQRAEIDSKPQLEIHADDVRCSHGSTTGQLDLDALFYLRARGLSEAAARRLLVAAFASEVTDTLPLPALRNRTRDAIERRLGQLQSERGSGGTPA